MNINKQLQELYASKWELLCKALDENGLTGYEYNPLLLRVDDPEDFAGADIRVMIFGQDMSSGNWYEYDRHAPLEICMDSIKTFDNALGAVKNGKRQSKGMGGGMNQFINMFNHRNEGKKVRYVWNDIAKMGRELMGNDKREILSRIENEYFPVIKDEINIIKPDIILFFTGNEPYWESRLQHSLGIDSNSYKPVAQWNISHIAQVELPCTTYPSVKYAFRTYHPCYFKGRGERYEAIINEIKL